MTPETGVFGIFQGGGAKGLAHVGALAAAERLGFRFFGVAGTSAGAILAALVAAGYSAREIFDPDNPKDNILETNSKQVLDILGREKWDSFNEIEKFFRPDRLPLTTSIIIMAPFFLTILAFFVRFREWISTLGFFNTSSVIAITNTILHRRVSEVYRENGLPEPPPEILFKHLDYTRFPEKFLPLKIIGTNTRTRSVELFDLTTTPEMPVAQAVAASIAIPFFFSPVRCRPKGPDGSEDEFVDGGLVSNLPVWVFIEEKRRIERSLRTGQRVRTLAFTLKAKGMTDAASGKTELEPGSLERLFQLAGTVIQAGLGGAQSIAQRFVSDLETVSVSTSMGLLDFAVSRERLAEGYQEGFGSAEPQLRQIADRSTDRVQPILAALAEAAGVLSAKTRDQSLRVTVFHRFGDHQLVPYARAGAIGGVPNYDDRLVRDSEDDPMAACLTSGGPVLTPLAWENFDYLLPSEQALVSDRLASAIYVRLSRAPAAAGQGPEAKRQADQVYGVLAIEADYDLAGCFGDSRFTGMLDAVKSRLSTLWREQD